MLEVLGTVFGSVLSGGATGLLGVVAQRWADHKNKQLDLARERQQQEFELAKRKADAEIMAQEWAARTRVAEVEAAGRSDVADSEALAASYALEPKRYSEGVKPGRVGGFFLILLDVVRGLVRPGLTVYLCVLTTMVYYQARELIGKEDLTSGEALHLEKMIVGTILYLTTTCVLWWFGTRHRGSAPK
jgi:hypothetical protein